MAAHRMHRNTPSCYMLAGYVRTTRSHQPYTPRCPSCVSLASTSTVVRVYVEILTGIAGMAVSAQVVSRHGRHQLMKLLLVSRLLALGHCGCHVATVPADLFQASIPSTQSVRNRFLGVVCKGRLARPSRFGSSTGRFVSLMQSS